MEFTELIHYSGEVANSLIYLSFLQTKPLPTVPPAFISEFVNGTISYIGGNAGQLKFSSGQSGRYYRFDLSKYLKKELDENEGRLNPKIKEALLYLVKPHLESGPMAYGSTTYLDDIILHFPFIMASTSSYIGRERIERIEKETLPSFSGEERKDLEGITKAMIPFIKEDVEYIKEHYSW